MSNSQPSISSRIPLCQMPVLSTCHLILMQTLMTPMNLCNCLMDCCRLNYLSLLLDDGLAYQQQQVTLPVIPGQREPQLYVAKTITTVVIRFLYICADRGFPQRAPGLFKHMPDVCDMARNFGGCHGRDTTSVSVVICIPTPSASAKSIGICDFDVWRKTRTAFPFGMCSVLEVAHFPNSGPTRPARAFGLSSPAHTPSQLVHINMYVPDVPVNTPHITVNRLYLHRYPTVRPQPWRSTTTRPTSQHP